MEREEGIGGAGGAERAKESGRWIMQKEGKRSPSGDRDGLRIPVTWYGMMA